MSPALSAGDEPEHHPVELGQPLDVVVRVAHERDPVAAHPLRKLERARPHRLALQAVHGLARVDDRTLARQVEEEVRVEALERERERVVVLHDDVADRRVVLGVRMLRLRVHRALEDVLDVGRLHLAAVVEVDAALEEEGVVPVVRRVPALGEPRDELSVAVHLHERLLDVVEDDRRRRRGGRGRQVEPGRFGHGLHDQALRRLRRRRARSLAEDERGEQQGQRVAHPGSLPASSVRPS